MRIVKESCFFDQLLLRYARSPSIALCRVPELELLSGVELQHPVLDHCCGDGYIAASVFPGVCMDAGVDISDKQLEAARQRGNYDALKWADAGASLPFEDRQFSTVINNSGIEHIPDLNRAMAEVARVLKPGGRMHFNVLNSRYFDWWPLSPQTAESYREFQPFYHALDEKAWIDVLSRHGFVEVSFNDYFPELASKILAELDFRYSAFYFRKSFSLTVAIERFCPSSWLISKWRAVLGDLQWDAAPGCGAGFLISATKGRV